MTPPSRATSAGRAYLDIQKRARADRRPVDEYLQFYVLECFLARLSRSRFAERYVLKGGALLAAFGERRPTRDIDFLAQGQTNDPDAVLAAVKETASIDIDDGVAFDQTTAKATLIRDEDISRRTSDDVHASVDRQDAVPHRRERRRPHPSRT